MNSHIELNEVLDKVISELKKDINPRSNEKISLINKYKEKINNQTFTKEDADSLIDLINSILNKEQLKNVLKDIKNRSLDNVTFDNLDMSIFNEEEISVIEEICDICKDEDIVDSSVSFDNCKVSYNERLMAYKKASISSILQDVKNLLNNIYDKKDEVIHIFKYIITLYRKYNIRKIREERIDELNKISNDFNNIISFLKKTYNERESYDEEYLIKNNINSINEEYLPLLSELIEKDIDYDELYDKEIENVIANFKKEIKEWKKKMTEYYQTDTSKEDVKENTENLVFCINPDLDLEKEGFKKEFLGTIELLENKSSEELKMPSGRKGMTRLRKTTENDKSKDFVEYLESKLKVKLHFVPYRFSSEANYRTGLIKFSTSQIVKEYLEERYGLPKQSAFYGIFQIITAIKVDHSEYHILENYVLNNCEYIENIAKIMSSENPNYDELNNIIDGFLALKKELLSKLNDDSKKI